MKLFIFAAFLAVAAAAANDEPIPIVRQDADIDVDGSYHHSYETGNGIKAEEHGALKGDAGEVTGSFEYASPDGTKYAVSYVANENGFQPEGAHLPVAPEVPAYIQRALDWIAAHPQPEDKLAKKF